MDDIRKIYHQNNYSNQILHTIATQVDSLSSEIKSIPKATTSRFPASYSAPHFQPSSFSKNQEAQLIRPTSSSASPPSPLLHKISQTLDKINSNLPSSSRINTIDQENPHDLSSSSDASSLSSSHEFISKIHQVEDSFLEPTELAPTTTVNKIRQFKSRQFSHPKWKQAETRNYYPRPTPPDIQYEERAKFHTAHYDGNSISNWTSMVKVNTKFSIPYKKWVWQKLPIKFIIFPKSRPHYF
ncbi:hypothetical protein M9H77_20912 [Catharanthus roseus]|uniref:Uncharacterized protein n=1 Tax=Catharanthus roseus TaxID=4058 RepID=A0ACC0AN42_CATRO|nr:hypothetical protein M9H77_20912 [Catharanthus roseus]